MNLCLHQSTSVVFRNCGTVSNLRWTNFPIPNSLGPVLFVMHLSEIFWPNLLSALFEDWLKVNPLFVSFHSHRKGNFICLKWAHVLNTNFLTRANLSLFYLSSRAINDKIGGRAHDNLNDKPNVLEYPLNRLALIKKVFFKFSWDTLTTSPS